MSKFQLNPSTQTIVTAAFVRSPQNVKFLVLGNRLFNLDNVYGLLRTSAINFLAPYPFLCLNSLIKTWSFAKKHHFVIVYIIFIASTNSISAWAIAEDILLSIHSTFDIFGKK